MTHFLVILSLLSGLSGGEAAAAAPNSGVGVFADAAAGAVCSIADTAGVFAVPLSEAEILCIEAEDQRVACEFTAALESYRKALALTTDSLRRVRLDSLQTLCRNGAAMAQFCFRPKVAARKRFGAGEFLGHMPISAAQRERLALTPVDTLMLSDSTHIAAFFPIENDGYVYFSSRELYGMGGSDLYRCERIPGSSFVGEPENLGFPYSSPADDFVLAQSPDGKFTVFASNRGCGPDEVYLYALVNEAVPVRSAVPEGAALRALCELIPASEAPVSAVQRKALDAYRRASAECTRQQDTLTRHNRELDALRRRYTVASGAEKQFLGSEISRMEVGLPALRKKHVAAMSRLSEAEAECRRQGVSPEPSVPVWEF